MVRRVGAFAAVAIAVATLASCTTTTRYAVFAPRQALDDNGGCFRQCQAVREHGTPAYLDCVRACPDNSVNQDARCEDFPPDPSHVCMPEQTRTVSTWKTLLLIGGLILLTFAATAFVPNL